MSATTTNPPAAASGSRFKSTPMQSPELMEHVDRTLRSGDVILNVMSKSGQTLLQMLLWSLMAKGDTDRSYLLAESPWLEKLWIHMPCGQEGTERLRLNTVEEQIALFDGLNSPRVFKQHVEWSQVARPVDPGVWVHYLTVTRHIEDLPYSWYRHATSMKDEFTTTFVGFSKQDQTFDETFDSWLDKSPHRWQWFRDMWQRKKEGRVKLIRYEDMVSDMEAVARDLLGHLGWDEPSDMALVLSRTDRAYMTEDKLFGTDRCFERFVGSPGGGGRKNRDMLSDGQRKRLRDRCEAEFEPDLLRHLYRED